MVETGEERARGGVKDMEMEEKFGRMVWRIGTVERRGREGSSICPRWCRRGLAGGMMEM